MLAMLTARLRVAMAAEDWDGLEALDAEVRAAVANVPVARVSAEEVEGLLECYRDVVACLAARRDQIATELGGVRMQSRIRSRYGA